IIQLTGTIFKLNFNIKETNVLTKFHQNWVKNVTSRVFTCFRYIHIKKNAPPTGDRVCSPIWTIFELIRDINKTNVLTNFHDDWAKVVTSRVFTSNVNQLTGTIFELNCHIKETNVQTKFHENWAKNVTSRVFTCFHYIHIEKNAPPTGGHVFSPIWTIFELVRDINKTNVLKTFMMIWQKFHVIPLTGTIFELNSHIKETNVLIKFHENWAKNVNSRVFTCFHYIHIEKNAPPTGGHVFSPICTIFKLVRDINKTNKTAPPTGGHVFQRTGTTFELNQHIIKTNILTKLHEDLGMKCDFYIGANRQTDQRTNRPTDRQGKNNMSPTSITDRCLLKLLTGRSKGSNCCEDSHVIQLTGTIFELNSRIKETNVLSKFHENWAKNVTSTRKMPRPLATTFFLPIPTIFKLVRDINKTNVLTNFHDDWANIVTSRVFTRENCHYIHIDKNAPPTGGHVFSPISTIFELVRDIN
ncbi:hypothetical protein DPMN_058870, partial [Dreissena polymorpha]